MSTEHATLVIGADKSGVASAMKQAERDIANAGTKGGKGMGDGLLKGLRGMSESVGQMGAFLGAALGREMAGSVGQQLNSILGPGLAGAMMGGGVGAAIGVGAGVVSNMFGDARNRALARDTTMLTTAEQEAAVKSLGEQARSAQVLVDKYGGIAEAAQKVAAITKLDAGEREKASFEFFKQTGLTVTQVRKLGEALDAVNKSRTEYTAPPVDVETGMQYQSALASYTANQENNALDAQIRAARAGEKGTGTPQGDVLMASTTGLEYQGPFHPTMSRPQRVPLDAFQGPQHPDLGALARFNAWDDARRSRENAATNMVMQAVSAWVQSGAVPITPVNGE